MPTIRDRNLVATKNGKTNHSDTQSSNTNESLHRNKKQRYIDIYIILLRKISPVDSNSCVMKFVSKQTL